MGNCWSHIQNKKKYAPRHAQSVVLLRRQKHRKKHLRDKTCCRLLKDILWSHLQLNQRHPRRRLDGSNGCLRWISKSLQSCEHLAAVVPLWIDLLFIYLVIYWGKLCLLPDHVTEQRLHSELNSNYKWCSTCLIALALTTMFSFLCWSDTKT